MKLLQIGCGAIGSFYTQYLTEAMCAGQIEVPLDISLADNDIVELPQIRYQNFKIEDGGLNKAVALMNRYDLFGIKAIQNRITKESQLKGFDFIICCVDNEPTRALVYNYAFKKNIPFLDFRARGRRVCAFPKLATKEENLKFLDVEDTTCYSCQDQVAKDTGNFNYGNKIVAMIGVQMLINHLRGIQNKPILLNV